MNYPELSHRYELLRPLGAGGMGEVFLVRDRITGAQCALKHLSARARVPRHDLQREFRALAGLRHPAIVSVYECGVSPDGHPYFTMEYVPGVSVDQALVPGDWSGLARAGSEIAHGLEVLHAASILHGDLKPSNVLATATGDRRHPLLNLRLVDFGLSATLGEGGATHRGSPGYAAPEVVRGAPMEVASDLYALGATLFTLACRRLPFRGTSVEALLDQQLTEAPDGSVIENAGVPPRFVELILRLMAPEPERRPNSARQVRREIEALFPESRTSLLERLGAAVMVGRTHELELIESTLDRRGPPAVLVSGPPGIGKSALLSEAGRRAALAGHPVVGFTPARLSELLCGATADDGDALSRHLRSLKSGSEATPLVLIDDAHGLDAASRLAIRRFILDPDAPSVAWVMAEPEDRDADADQIMEDSGFLTVHRLGPIARPAAAEMIAARLRERPPAELEEFLWERAHGHPGMTVQALRALAANGGLHETDAGIVADREVLAKLAQEPAAELVSPLLDRAPEAARDLLAVLALVGAASAAELNAVLPGADESLGTLRELGLIQESDAERMRLVNPALAERIVTGRAPERLQALIDHALRLPSIGLEARVRLLMRAGRVDEALEAARAIDDRAIDVGLAETVAGLLDASRPEESAAWHERVARRRFGEGRYQAAIPHLQRSLAGSAGTPSYADRLGMLATAHLRVGDVARTGETLDELLGLPLAPATRSKALTQQCVHLRGIGQLDAAEASGRRALEVGEEAADDECIGAAAQALASLLLARGQLDGAREMCDRALTAHIRSGVVLAEIRTRGIRAALAQAEGHTEEALTIYTAAQAQARAAGQRLAIEELVINQSMLSGDLGRWSEVAKLNSEAARLAIADHRPRNATAAYTNLALAQAFRGHPASARREARIAIRLARRHLPALESSGWRVLAQVERSRGRLGPALRAAKRALALAARRGTAIEQAWCHLEYGAVLEAMHKLEPALHAWLAAPDLPAGQESLRTLLDARAALAALHLGELDRSRELESRIDERAAARFPLAAAFVQELRVHSALAANRDTDAQKGAQAMLEAFERISATAERARAVLTLAARLHERGTFPTAARTWLEWASSEFERLGDHRSRERVLSLLVRWIHAGTGPSRAADETLLEAVSELLMSLPNLKELSKKAMELVVRQLEAERGVFLVVDPATGQFQAMAEYGSVNATVRRHAIGYSRRVVRHVAKSGGTLLVTDAARDPRARFESVVRLKLRSILCVPLMAADHVVGAVYLDDSRRAQAFGPSAQQLLERIGHLLAVAVDRSYAHETITRTNERLMGENRELRKAAARESHPLELLGSSMAMRRIIPVVERASETQATVLITGENGTGKELVARMIHSGGARRLRPFVVVNCGAITETLLESELFGILPNVATGVRGRDGCFRQAEGGTLFLDEIGEMPARQQVALLSAIANREVMPVGGSRTLKVNVRIIAATNCDLGRMIEAGTFRQDLFFRLNVLPLKLPPLRERKTDIPMLARHFAAQVAALQKRPVPELTGEFLALLMRADWPGNVRQLQNTIERVMALHGDDQLAPHMLADDPDFSSRRTRSGPASGSLTEQVEELERIKICEALRRWQGNQSAAARELGILEQTLRYRMEKYEIEGLRRKTRRRSSRRDPA
jgi:Nif-specific regulatory protein